MLVACREADAQDFCKRSARMRTKDSARNVSESPVVREKVSAREVIVKVRATKRRRSCVFLGKMVLVGKHFTTLLIVVQWEIPT